MTTQAFTLPDDSRRASRTLIAGKKVLVLGGGGMVGLAVCRQILPEKPSALVVHALAESEADSALIHLTGISKSLGLDSKIEIAWGNILFREDLKDQPRDRVLSDPSLRRIVIDDILNELSDSSVERMFLWKLLVKHSPDIIIDCINTATAVAYQNIFERARSVVAALDGGNERALHESAEYLLASLYVPQLVKHIQILRRAFDKVKPEIYIKIGTTGTGGMG